MRKIVFLFFVFTCFTGHEIMSQNNPIDHRFKGKEKALVKFLSENLTYPAAAVENKIIGYSISGITITPKGNISDIFIINPVHEEIDEDILRVLKMTKRKWLKCDTTTTNQTFYIPIAYNITTIGNSPEVFDPVNRRFNFTEPIVLNATIFSDALPESNEDIAQKLAQFIFEENYPQALESINELIRRNPFNKDFYQIRIMIHTKLKNNEMVMQNVKKIQNFIPGVSLDELIN